MDWEIWSIYCVQDGAKVTTLGYRSLNWEAGRVFSTLTKPKEAVPKIGLEDKIVGAEKGMFELEQQARVPNPNEFI